MEDMLRFKVRGVPPGLLQHSPHWLMRKAVGGPTSKKIPTPEVEASLGLYIVDESGTLIHPSIATEKCSVAIPADAFVEAIFDACVGKKIGKTSAAKILKAAIRPPDAEPWCVLRDPKTWKPYRMTIIRDKKTKELVLEKPLAPYTVDVRRVVVQCQGVLRARPLFHAWGCEVALIASTDTVSEEVVRDVLTTAGKLIGVCEYRPRYGRFEVLED